MIETKKGIKINNSDELIQAIRNAGGKLSFEDYVRATGLDKEFIFKILKGEIEDVDDETLKKLKLQ